jgi:general secretion pathway protein F
MAVFTYKAVSANGSVTTGELDAGDRGEALRILDRKGLQPVKLTQSTATAKGATKAQSTKDKNGGNGGGKSAAPAPSAAKAVVEEEIPAGPIKLKRAEVVLFTEELSDMLGAGLQLEPALRAMGSRQQAGNLKFVSEKVRQDVRDGSSFSNALRKASPSFGDLYCSLAAAGEASGALHTILLRQSIYLKRLQEIQGVFVVALIYPAILMLSGVVVAIIFVTKLIPQLTSLLESTPGAELPGGAKFLIGASDFLQKWWIVLALLVVASLVLFKAWKDAESNRPKWDRIQINLPLFGNLVRQRFYVQFLETMSTLVGNGLPLLRALELSRDATPNLFYKDHLAEMIEMVGDGRALSRAMLRSNAFPPMLIDMVSVGEQTGKIDRALARAAERYDKELNGALQKIMALVTPAVLVMMAVLIGAMAYMMITAIFQTISNLGAG